MTTISTSSASEALASLLRAGAASGAAIPAAGPAKPDATGPHGPAVVLGLSDAARQIAQQGEAASAGPLDVKSFDEQVQQRTDALAQKLTAEFEASNIRVDEAIALRVDSSGTVHAEGPQKDKIEKYFRDNPDAAKELKAVASLHALRALNEALRLYTEEKKSARSKDEQTAAFDRYAARTYDIQSLSGFFTLDQGKLTAAAGAYADLLSADSDKAPAQKPIDLLA